jgi:hypothetical protein
MFLRSLSLASILVLSASQFSFSQSPSSDQLPDRLPPPRKQYVTPPQPSEASKKATGKRLFQENLLRGALRDVKDTKGLSSSELREWQSTPKDREVLRKVALRLYDKTSKAGRWNDANFYATNLCLMSPSTPQYWVMRAKSKYKLGVYNECVQACTAAGDLNYETAELVDLQTAALSEIEKTIERHLQTVTPGTNAR